MVTLYKTEHGVVPLYQTKSEVLLNLPHGRNERDRNVDWCIEQSESLPDKRSRDDEMNTAIVAYCDASNTLLDEQDELKAINVAEKLGVTLHQTEHGVVPLYQTESEILLNLPHGHNELDRNLHWCFAQMHLLPEKRSHDSELATAMTAYCDAAETLLNERDELQAAKLNADKMAAYPFTLHLLSRF